MATGDVAFSGTRYLGRKAVDNGILLSVQHKLDQLRMVNNGILLGVQNKLDQLQM